jgi:hypothetical protein
MDTFAGGVAADLGKKTKRRIMSGD